MTRRTLLVLGAVGLGLTLVLAGLITKHGLTFSWMSAASAQAEDPTVENQQLRYANQQLEEYIKLSSRIN
jgi:hypothetical protein